MASVIIPGDPKNSKNTMLLAVGPCTDKTYDDLKGSYRATCLRWSASYGRGYWWARRGGAPVSGGRH